MATWNEIRDYIQSHFDEVCDSIESQHFKNTDRHVVLDDFVYDEYEDSFDFFFEFDNCDRRQEVVVMHKSYGAMDFAVMRSGIGNVSKNVIFDLLEYMSGGLYGVAKLPGEGPVCIQYAMIYLDVEDVEVIAGKFVSQAMGLALFGDLLEEKYVGEDDF